MKSSDVIIVGGGAIGACCALELAQAGAEVTLLERGSELAWSCSAGNLGMICPGHSAPIASTTSLKIGLSNLLKTDGSFFLKPTPTLIPWLVRFIAACHPERFHRGTQVMRDLSVESLALHASLAETAGETTFSRRGMMVAAETEAGFSLLKREARENQKSGLRTETLDSDATRELEPEFGPNVFGAVFYPDEAHCDPEKFVKTIGLAAENTGARILTNVEAISLLYANNRVQGLKTTAGTMSADTVILAAGAWTSQLAKQAETFVPVIGGKGYHIEVPDKPSTTNIPTLFIESRVGITPMEKRIRIGGTLELSGLNESISENRVRTIMRSAIRVAPGLADRPQKKVWHGLRPCSPDGVPIIGKSPSMEGLVIATGHAHMGLTLAPITGKLVRQIILSEKSDHNLAAIEPDRFQPLPKRFNPFRKT